MNETIRRDRMVRTLASRGVSESGVLDAMRRVPREKFVEEALRGKAYSDSALPIGDKQTISQPLVVARMTELLEPDGTGRVLEIGTGSGYQAAVLSGVFQQVYTVERNAALSNRSRQLIRSLGIENVHFKIFDGTYGWGEFAPYRGILVTAAAPDVPQPLLDQLQDGGTIVIPLGDDTKAQVLTSIHKQGSTLTRGQHGACRFVRLVGKFGWPA